MNSSIQKRNHVHVLGRGQETLIFAHGFGAHQNVWRHQVAAFQDRYRIVLFDHVGCGQSDFNAYDPQRYSSLHTYAADVLELCEELNVSGCTWVGHSFSGMVGLLAASKAPSRFRRLVLVGASPRYLNDPAEDYFGGSEQPQLDAMYATLSSQFDAWVTSLATASIPGRPELIREFSRSLHAMRPDIALSLFRTILQSDHRAELSQLKLPALIVQTAEDFIVPEAVAKYMVRRLPHARWAPLEGVVGHNPHLTVPETLNKVIDAYLASAP
ncbi:alpha/beta fold hydrolase [Stigmatella aurantiaca]|uniref:Hydrolase n=1 Tax=Stigmatella aurantiaca (strain DW4/3-1) TaxID=378806 RepID=Q08RR6_STIAD|nr:alpha/beta hydrolase [Stigmatella aurantiaca]ADO72745.1 Hydrolase, alpha/beta fold family [Stigmatella aurantiaca DW4/3-1]EAU63167.1 hydrolase [Stigmatella aurantiaca DW4/3-1]